MYVLLSPAKSLVEPPAAPDRPFTLPQLLDQAEPLAATARKLSVKQLGALMDISEDLAELNVGRFASWSTQHDPTNARQAALSFNGDVYQGLDAASLSVADLEWAQDHVGILSGLYGLLRPLDLIHPYRLEMGSALKTRRGASLVDYWGDRITRAVRETAGDGPIVNLASQEYFGAVQPKALGRVITPVFQDLKDGKARTLGFFAKQARGAMTRWIVQNRVDEPEALQACTAMGYAFAPHASRGDKWVFQREQPPLVAR